MHTSKEWWQKTKSNKDLLTNWLTKQYHGEVTAADRIEKYALSESMTKCEYTGPNAKTAGRTFHLLQQIAKEERLHAHWVGGLLQQRGVVPKVLQKTERYWDETLKDLTDLKSICAVAAHAEKMRLERIEVIAADPDAPADIRKVFQRILEDERGHERTFAMLAGDEALAKAIANHQQGLQAIGLITAAEVL